MAWDDPLDPYIGAYDPRVMGRVRGSPAGMNPIQADEASPFALTRERIKDELDNNAALRRAFDANTTAEVGNDPAKRRWYQALTIDRAVQTGKPLAEIVNAPDYYPSSTTRKGTTTGMGTDPSLWEGANPANYATGNASYDPVKGRYVGFAGGPQTSSFGSTDRGSEYGGIEGQRGLDYARAMGYEGPARTAIGPQGPRGNDLAGLAPGQTPENYGSVASISPYGRPNMDPQGLIEGLQQQQQGQAPQQGGGLFGGLGGLIGAIDPQKMAYLGMIAKGLDPYSSIDPQAMLKNAQQAQQDAMDRQIRQQQLQLNTRAQDRAEMESERPQYITRPDGSIVAVPRQGGSPTIITPGVKDLGETAKQKDYAFAVKNGFKGSFEEFNAQTSMAPEKAYDVKQNTQLAEEQINIQKQGFNAAPQIAILNQMEKLMDTPGFRSGTGAAFQQTLNKAWTAMGGDPKAPASVEAFNALAQKSVIDDLGSLGTGISNADRDYISGTAASIANTPEGNKQIIAVKRALAQRKQEIAALARDYAKAHGGRLDIGFYDVAEGYAQKNPMFKDVPTPGGDGGGGANAAPASAAPSSAPPRPSSVPPGSAYSPSRKQWRTPDGQIIDAGQ